MKLIELSESGFANSGGRYDPTLEPGYAAVKLAMENPSKVVEVKVPAGMKSWDFLKCLQRAARDFPYKLRISQKKAFREAGKAHITRGDTK